MLAIFYMKHFCNNKKERPMPIQFAIKNCTQMTYWVFTAFLMLLSTSATIAQAQESAEPANLKTLKLRPLDELTELALQNAPALKAQQVDYLRQTLAWKTQKNSWADMFSLNAATLYGNGTVLDANNNGVTTAYALNDKRSLTFNLSLGVRLSAGDFLNRPKKAEMQRLQLDRLQQDRALTEQNLREAIAVLYTQLELALKLLRIKSEALENQRIASALAEKYFKEGNLQATEYSTMLGKVSNAEEQFEQAKAEAKKFTLVLKNLVGTSVF
jgi:outer membrane protein TolC